MTLIIAFMLDIVMPVLCIYVLYVAQGYIVRRHTHAHVCTITVHAPVRMPILMPVHDEPIDYGLSQVELDILLHR